LISSKIRQGVKTALKKTDRNSERMTSKVSSQGRKKEIEKINIKQAKKTEKKAGTK
jgi:hypothetical protein